MPEKIARLPRVKILHHVLRVFVRLVPALCYGRQRINGNSSCWAVMPSHIQVGRRNYLVGGPFRGGFEGKSLVGST